MTAISNEPIPGAQRDNSRFTRSLLSAALGLCALFLALGALAQLRLFLFLQNAAGPDSGDAGENAFVWCGIYAFFAAVLLVSAVVILSRRNHDHGSHASR